MSDQLSIRFVDDVWVLPSKGSLSDYTFYFDFYPSIQMKDQVKRFMLDNINSRRIKTSTMHRYSYSIRHFIDFVFEEKLQIMNFGDVSHQVIDGFTMYLLKNMDKPTTRNLAMASLKAVITHGQRFEYENFPTKNIFDGNEFQILQTEDALLTRYIPDSVMTQIETAISSDFSDPSINNLICIVKDTGIRLSEALELTPKSLLDDFLGKPIIHVVSDKAENERFIPVSTAVKKAILDQINRTDEARGMSKIDSIFCYFSNRKKDYVMLNQVRARDRLSEFVLRNGIRENNGQFYQLTFHAFRHTLGTKMMSSGLTSIEIQEYLGHESSHSTAHYAKVVNAQVSKEMKKAGIIGKIVLDLSSETLGEKAQLDSDTLKSAALPDGACSKPINNEGKVCKKFNMCLFCPKFITTPKYLDVHKDHLQRVRKDKEIYMQENYIGTEHHLGEVEEVLVEIIERLELIKNG